jgi:predicted nuclease of predicted toxin-antitoxin system
VRFLIDEQLPECVAQWLVDQGHDAQHVRAIRMSSASDQAIWGHALATRSVIVTKDRDFVEWSIARSPAAVVLWLRFGNLKRSILLERLEIAWPRILESLQIGALVVEAGP